MADFKTLLKLKDGSYVMDEVSEVKFTNKFQTYQRLILRPLDDGSCVIDGWVYIHFAETVGSLMKSFINRFAVCILLNAHV